MFRTFPQLTKIRLHRHTMEWLISDPLTIESTPKRTCYLFATKALRHQVAQSILCKSIVISEFFVSLGLRGLFFNFS